MKPVERFYIQSPLTRIPHTVQPEDNIILLGSCFAESIGQYFDKYLFSQITNPFGTLYDSHSLAHNLALAHQKSVDAKTIRSKIFCHEEVFYSHDLHGDISALSAHALEEEILSLYPSVHEHIKRSQWMIISLGTSIIQVFEHKFPVANCHKLPRKHFTSHYQSVNEIVANLKKLVHHAQAINPLVKFILTISPIRHLAMGMVENSQSKARLQVAIQELLLLPEMKEVVFYFPAFEIMVDELRDYRFYASDYLHPNQQAIDYIWGRFWECCFSEASLQYMAEIEPILHARNHRMRFADTLASRKFLATFYQRTKSLQQRYPKRNWEELLRYFGKGAEK